ncbi:hypothetical protein PoB_000162100 [Plakobranchus ocellatus]|uniref:Uncharacterized protein n=1 Tax=Plakobranchus ocellatus TaxID=259542 RepID=A0AAV3XYF9_9GAST|nr:hypothetical protein PoB_000162100 [Plakobranchus ocellatus]
MLSEFPDSDNEPEATTKVVDELYRLQNEASTSSATELCNTNSETEASIEPTVTIDVINQIYHTQNDFSSSDTESRDTHSQSDHYSDPDYVPESNNSTNTSLPLSGQEASPVDTNQGANFDPEPFSEETDQEASTKKIRPRKRKRKPETWLQNVRTKKIAAGEPYINKSGKHVPGRSIDEERLKFREVMWFSYGQSIEHDCVDDTSKIVEHLSQVWCRYRGSVFEPWKKVAVFRRNCSSSSVELHQKYTTPLGIKAAKLKDLKSLGQKGILPQYACDFYNSLVADDNVERDNLEDYDDD